MRIEMYRNIEKKVKIEFHKLFLKQADFTIISNNCWGTFIYKKFGLPYQSPFINAMIFAPDYIALLENFSIEKLKKLTFIEHSESKFIDEMKRLDIYGKNYPLGLIDDKYEINFLHYTCKKETLVKWLKRCERINSEKLIFKFSDGDLFEDSMAHRFEALPFKNKICFTAKPFLDLKSNIWIEKFKSDSRVKDEWKHFEKHLNIYKFLNGL